MLVRSGRCRVALEVYYGAEIEARKGYSIASKASSFDTYSLTMMYDNHGSVQHLRLKRLVNIPLSEMFLSYFAQPYVPQEHVSLL